MWPVGDRRIRVRDITLVCFTYIGDNTAISLYSLAGTKTNMDKNCIAGVGDPAGGNLFHFGSLVD
jgi:hypothetical protein